MSLPGLALTISAIVLAATIILPLLHSLGPDPGADTGARLGISLIGGMLGPSVLLALVWFSGGWRGISPRTAWYAVGIGAALAAPAAVALTVLVPLVAAGFGAILVLPICVGAAEEAAKAMIAVRARREEYASPTQGILIGILTALGFAALENVGYVWMALQEGDGSVAMVILVRTLTAAIHALWTGALCYAIWRSWVVSFRLDGAVIRMYLFVTILHATWDISLMERFAWAPSYWPPALSGTLSLVLFLSCLASACSHERRQAANHGPAGGVTATDRRHTPS